MSDCLFCKIVNGNVPADIVAESELALAFRDIQPQAPVHILVIPKTHYTGIRNMTDEAEMGALIRLANEVANQEDLENGYRLVINQGVDGGQSVFHTHVHVLGKRAMHWPPG